MSHQWSIKSPSKRPIDNKNLRNPKLLFYAIHSEKLQPISHIISRGIAIKWINQVKNGVSRVTPLIYASSKNGNRIEESLTKSSHLLLLYSWEMMLISITKTNQETRIEVFKKYVESELYCYKKLCSRKWIVRFYDFWWNILWQQT